MENNLGSFFALIGGFMFFVVAIVIWSVIWKGIALWKSARNNHSGWFIVFLLINTMGILEILYIYIFSKKYNTDIVTEPTNQPKV